LFDGSILPLLREKFPNLNLINKETILDQVLWMFDWIVGFSAGGS